MLKLLRPRAATGRSGNYVITGDFNASCTYAKPTDLVSFEIHGSRFAWIVTDDIDTTVSTTTFCADDRIVVTKDVIARI